jgi:glycosyltransferase involved in cell wall biosynthesis
MKVLHVAEIVQGGVSTYLAEAVPAQCAALGTDAVRVLVAADEVRFLGALDPRVIRTLPPRRRDAVGLLRLFGAVRRAIAAERPDIVHLHSSFAGALVRLGLLLPRGKGAPKIVYCAHGWAFNMAVPERRRRVYAGVERLLARATDAIVCISAFERDTARRRGLPGRLLRLIPNGIAADPPAVPPDAVPATDPARLNLLFVGRQDRQKGFDILLDAMARLEDRPITLHVLGDRVVDGAGGAEPARARPNVVFHGWQPREAVGAFMAAADALVMPSRWEGFGLVAAEAMRQGLPVCASRVDALPELVSEGVSGHLFPPDDPAALAALLAGLDREELRRMGPGARRWFLERFTADAMNRALLDLYAELCRKPERELGRAGALAGLGEHPM